MSKIVVRGGQKLAGDIEIEGSKNAVLPVLAATVLNGGVNVIKNCPDLKDVEIALKILRTIGCKVKREKDVVTVDSSTLDKTEIPEDLAVEMRSSIVFLGPMLARCKKVTISYPGGCDPLWALLFPVKNMQNRRRSGMWSINLEPAERIARKEDYRYSRKKEPFVPIKKLPQKGSSLFKQILLSSDQKIHYLIYIFRLVRNNLNFINSCIGEHFSKRYVLAERGL